MVFLGEGRAQLDHLFAVLVLGKQKVLFTKLELHLTAAQTKVKRKNKPSRPSQVCCVAWFIESCLDECPDFLQVRRTYWGGGGGSMACCLQLSSLLENAELGVEDIVGFIESRVVSEKSKVYPSVRGLHDESMNRRPHSAN